MIKEEFELKPKLIRLQKLYFRIISKRRSDNQNEQKIEEKDNVIIEIKENDIIFFDINYSEVWLDLTLNLKEEESSESNEINSYNFELKVNAENYQNDLDNILEYTFGDFLQNGINEHNDYYYLKNKKITFMSNKNLDEHIDKIDNNLQLNSQKNMCNIINENEENQNPENFPKKLGFNEKIICDISYVNLTKKIHLQNDMKSYIDKYFNNKYIITKNNIIYKYENKTIEMKDLTHKKSQNWRRELYLSEEEEELKKILENIKYKFDIDMKKQSEFENRIRNLQVLKPEAPIKKEEEKIIPINQGINNRFFPKYTFIILIIVTLIILIIYFS